MLSTALGQLGRNEDALAELDRSLPVLRRLVAAGRRDLEPGLAFGLRCRAPIAARLGRYDEVQRDAALADAGGTFTWPLIRASSLQKADGIGEKSALPADSCRKSELSD